MPTPSTTLPEAPLQFDTPLASESEMEKAATPASAAMTLPLSEGLGDQMVTSGGTDHVTNWNTELSRGFATDSKALSSKRKFGLLAVFCLSMFVDILGSSAFFVFTGIVTSDLDIIFEQQSWVITSYAVTFASFLLFWGRVSDLYTPRPVFTFGFICFGLFNLVISFLTDKYSFFIIRAVSGIAGAALVPSSYRLIAINFPPDERSRAYTIYGMTGSIANVTATIFAGVIGLIPETGQMSAWRWFFRIVAALSIPAGVWAHYLIPQTEDNNTADRWRRLDLFGIASMLGAILFLIMGLTFGASYGWRTVAFLVPLFLSLALFPLCFWWESRRPVDYALLPMSLWRVPNLLVLIVFSTLILGWWGVIFIPIIEIFHQVDGESLILAAVRTLPIGIAAAVISFVMIRYPKISARPRWSIMGALLLCIAAYCLLTQATSLIGTGYWAFVFPAMVIGSGGMQLVLLSTMVGVMMAAPRDQAGVVGAVLQVAMQTGSVVALSIQAGLLTVHPGGIYDFRNVQASWYFELGWTILWLIGFAVLYRPSKGKSTVDITEIEIV